MNKLGLKFVWASDGYKEKFTINGDGWTRVVTDCRSELINYSLESASCMMLMSFKEHGSYITIAKWLENGTRSNDYIAAWIYVPNNIVIDGELLCDIIHKVKTGIEGKHFTEDYYKDIFIEEYNETETVPFSIPDKASTEILYGKRDIEKTNSLAEIVGMDRYQEYYAPYKVIYLCGCGFADVDANNRIKNLTNEELVKQSILCPPATRPQGVEIYYMEKPFDKPIRVPFNKVVHLTLKRSGFENITDSVTVNKNRYCYTPGTSEWKVSISMSMFFVRDEENNKISNFKVFINNQLLRSLEPIQISEISAQKVSIKVEANGFEAMTYTNQNLTNIKEFTVNLKRCEQEQKWKIELANGRNGEITLRSKHLPTGKKYESPLKGYTIERDDLLEYSDSPWMDRLIGFLSACLLGLLIWGGYMAYEWMDSEFFNRPSHTELTDSPRQAAVQTTDSMAEQRDSTVAQQERISLEEAIHYLDNNSTWKKEGMEEHSELQGLFDALNNYNLQYIVDRKGKFSSSTQFTRLVDEIENVRDKTALSPKYSNHNIISVEDYISKLRQTSRPVEELPAPTQTPSPKQDAQDTSEAKDITDDERGFY